MMRLPYALALITGLAAVPSWALAEPSANTESTSVCQGFGPQTPRDIDQPAGSNRRLFAPAPPYQSLNLCNIHFHHNAEHKAAAFAIYAGEGENGIGGGYQCAISKQLSANELQPPAGDVCHGLKPGDTIEVHWVHSSCDIKPGPGLGACLSDRCANPDLRVETQVFTLVNDPAAMDFRRMSYANTSPQGLHQAISIPNGTGTPVQFRGSTTGPSFSESTCSPLQVTWSVRPSCAKLDINSLAAWCESNVFDEDHAHGVRKLVTDVSLLSEIK